MSHRSFLLFLAILVLGLNCPLAAATTGPANSTRPALACQSIPLPDKSSCDQACGNQEAVCVAVQTAMGPAPDPVTCDTLLPGPTATICRCCAVR